MTTILEFRKLSGAGVFADVPPPVAPQFLKYNLIYGFNGSGKTTLSRIFASLEGGTLDGELPEGTRFEIALSDGSTIGSAGGLDRLKGRVLVFNADFQERNLQWKRGFAQPVFIVGEQQAEAVQALESANARLAEARARLPDALAARRTADQQLELFKRDTAREISEALILGRRYNATNLEQEFARRSYAGCLVSEQDLPALVGRLTQEGALDPLRPVVADWSVLGGLASKVQRVLSEVIGELKIADFNAHPSMLAWASSGLDYHQSAGIKDCLFCGGTLQPERMQQLQEVINNRYSTISREINTLIAACLGAEKGLAALVVPSRNDLSTSVRDRFSQKAIELGEQSQAARLALKALQGALERKNSSLDKELSVPASGSQEALEKLDGDLRATVSELNSLIADHNTEGDRFAQLKEEAAERLKQHILARAEPTYKLHVDAAVVAKRASDEIGEEVAGLDQTVVRLSADIRAHGPAADVITKGLQDYLGRGDLDVIAVEGGFQLRRGGKQVRGPLSEGEKTAIALCYFMSTIQAERRRLSDLIVVIDDPVSSLDGRALNYSFNMLKSRLDGVKQLFLLTHNLHYMSQVKKWLKPKSRAKDDGKPAVAAILFIDPRRTGEGVGASRLIAMPKHLRDWDSEYHYLFDMVMRLAQDPGEMDGYVYLMPNAIRKVLEVFLAFKLPGNDGLGSKVDTFVKDKSFNWDPVRVRAIESLVQVESHGDSVEDLVSFSDMTVEEIVQVAEALMYLIHVVDPTHSARMRKACA